MKLFQKKSEYKKQLEELEKTQAKLIKTTAENLELSESNINTTREFYEKMRNHGIRRFDNFLNLCLIVDITSTDIFILNQNIRLSKHRFEKLLFARMLALVIIEYLKDINDLLGFKLIGELNTNHYNEFVPIAKIMNKDFSNIRKQNEITLTKIRNNISAHKTKEAMNLIQYIYDIDPDEICRISLEITTINTQLTSEGTKIFYKMISEAKQNRKNSK